MPAPTQPSPELFRRLAALRTFDGPPAVFWPAYLAVLADFTGAQVVQLWRRNPAPAPDQPPVEPWSRYVVYPPEAVRQAVPDGATAACETAEQAGHALRAVVGKNGEPQWAGALRLITGEPGASTIALLLYGDQPEQAATTALTTALLAVDTPSLYLQHRGIQRDRQQAALFAETLDLLLQLNQQTRFTAAAFIVCNELAHRLKCSRLGLGWIQGGLIHLRALSGTDKFDRRLEPVRALELAMEECADQDEELVHPAPDGSASVTRDHAAYAATHGTPHLASAPLRIDGKPVGVLFAERNGEAFTETDVMALRLYGDQITRRLADLHRRDRWWGGRLATRCREWAAAFVGVEHTWAKVGAIAGALLLLILIFGRWPYRVEAPFLLRSHQVVYLTAPFDGYIQEAPVEPGDVLPPGGVLARLDTRELLLEESAALADLTRHQREAERNRAAGELADMRIAEAQVTQATARLSQIRHRLGLAVLSTPFEATVVDGDLRQRLGAPVRAGDVLYQVARLDTLYFEAQVDERDIHEIRPGAKVTVAFESRPSETFELLVERLEPAARTTPQGNIFIVRCSLVHPPADWWRPGMGGVAKVSVGWRNLFWVITHRTFDYFRLHWWFW